MKFQLKSTSDQYAKLKIGIIPILLLVLGYALLMPKQVPETAVAVVRAENDKAVSRIVHTESGKKHSAKKQKSFPSISLVEMIAHDPFELLAVLRPEVAEQAEELSDLNETQSNLETPQTVEQIKENLKSCIVRGIFISGTNKAALIDSKVYHEGDFLAEGIQVLKINTHDVVLEINSSERITL